MPFNCFKMIVFSIPCFLIQSSD
uniref:Uncharacterized protein n=1 Tax=Arundo donax TaxID=35708 RepID=A0A0A9BIS8_ARUDO